MQPPPVGHTFYRSLLNIHPTHMCTGLPCVCLWTFIINSHNIFSCIPIDPPVLKQASFAVSSLTFFSPLLSLPFPNSWQPVQILAVCCSPLILCQTFLLHKYTRISQEEQNKKNKKKAIRHQMATRTLQLVIYSFFFLRRRLEKSQLLSEVVNKWWRRMSCLDFKSSYIVFILRFLFFLNSRLQWSSLIQLAKKKL